LSGFFRIVFILLVQRITAGVYALAFFYGLKRRMVEGFKGNATISSKINLDGTRDTYYLSCMKQATKYPRKTRTYKATDAVYKKARKVAKSKKESLSTVIEGWVKEYSNGNLITSVDMSALENLAPFVKHNYKSKKP
jgi:hypothetical protein